MTLVVRAGLFIAVLLLSAAPAVAQDRASSIPAKVRHVEPLYPVAAIERNVTGMVVAQLSVDEAGDVGRVKIVQGVLPLLNGAVRDALSQWRFQPMRQAAGLS